MAQITQPQVVINYISQLKKIIVNSHNQPTQLILQTDYNLNETYNFQVINKINQIVELDVNTTYQLYGTYIDAKKQVHVLFYTLGVTPRDNMLSFLVNTYTSEYLAYVKNNRTPIDISIVAKQNVGGSTKSYMVLRDSALANPRGYIEGQAPTDIVYQNVFNSQIPVSTAFGAGNDINLIQDLEGQEIYSFAFGDTLSTNNANQFVIGYNNEPDATKAFIVANSGNIFTIDYEGNVEANTISTTSLYINGEEIGQAVDDKVDQLSTAFDDKLSATEDWVSDTFETKESATQTFNELEGDINDISAFVSGLPADIAVKANQTDLDAISAFVSGFPQDINDLTNAVGSKANSTDLEALSTTVEGLAETKADLSSVYTKEEVYTYIETDVKINEATSGKADKAELTAYATKDQLTGYAELSAIPTSTSSLTNDSGFITSADIPVYTGVSPIAVDPSTHEISLEGEVGETYTAGFGLALDDQTNEFSLTGTVLSGDGSTIAINDNVISVIGGTGSGKEYSAGEGLALSGEGLSTFVLTAHIPTTVAELTDSSDYVQQSEITSFVTDQDVEDAISGKADLSAIPTGNAQLENTANYITEITITVGSDQYSSTSFEFNEGDFTWNSGTLDLSDSVARRDQIPSNADISGIASAVTESYGYITEITITVGSDQYSSTSFEFNEGDFTWNSGTLDLSNTVARRDQIPSNISDLNNDSGFATSAQVSAIASGYAGTGGITSAQVSSIVESYGYITGVSFTVGSDYFDSSSIEFDGGDFRYDTGAIFLNNVAHPEDIPTVLSQLTNDVGFATSSYVQTVSANIVGQIPTAPSTVYDKLSAGSNITLTKNDQTGVTTIASTGGGSGSNTLKFVYNSDEVDINTLNIDSSLGFSYNIQDGEAWLYVEKTIGVNNQNLGDTVNARVLNFGGDFAISQSEDEVDISLNSDLLTSYAQLSDIPTTVSELTNDANYISAITLSAYNASTMQNEAVQTSAIALASTDFVTWNGTIYINDTKFDIPTDGEISGIASAVTESYGYITGYTAGEGIAINNGVISCTVEGGSNISAVSQLINDVGFVTEPRVSAIASAYAQGGGGTTYTAGDGIDITNDEISVKLSGGDNVTLSTDATGLVTINATGGGGSAETTNQQTISAGFTYDSKLEIAKNTYTPTDGVITLSTFEVPAGSLDSNKVATFEEWVYSSGSLTGFAFDGVTLIGELPTEISQTNYYVFTRRILGSGEQFIKYEYGDIDWNNAPLTFIGKGVSNAISYTDPNDNPNVTLYYSKNGGEWTVFRRISDTITFGQGETVAVSGANNTFNQGQKWVEFRMTGSIEAAGNIQSLMNFNNSLTDYCYKQLFKNCTSLINVSNLKLPVTTLTNSCYVSMFEGCTNITSTPELPATVLNVQSYLSMFAGCTSLTKAPTLPATTLPIWCYTYMFKGCTSLTDAPYLPATVLTTNCYGQMFNGCSSLTSVNVAFADWNNNNSTVNWLSGVAANGTFTCPTALDTTTRDQDHVPANWTVVTE